MEPVDRRLPRFDQGVLALALVCGFVFEAHWVIPTWAALALLSALRPALSPVPRLFGAFVLPRLSESPAIEDGRPWRFAALLAAGLLGLGTLLLSNGEIGEAWVLGLAAATLGALASVGELCLGCRLYSRWSGSAEPELGSAEPERHDTGSPPDLDG